MSEQGMDETATTTGAELREKMNVPDDHLLFVKRAGRLRVIADYETYVVRVGDEFSVRPRGGSA